MSNLLNPSAREALRARFSSLNDESEARWGRLSVGQMVCHVADPMRIALGDLEAKDVSTFFTRNILKRLVLWGAPPPKARIETFPEIDHAKGGGTQPTTLGDDIAAFETLADRLTAHIEAGQPLHANPIFGKLTAKQWGRLLYGHTVHHLKQFGA